MFDLAIYTPPHWTPVSKLKPYLILKGGFMGRPKNPRIRQRLMLPRKKVQLIIDESSLKELF